MSFDYFSAVFLCSRRGTHCDSRRIRLDVVVVAGRVNIHLKKQTTRTENLEHEQVVQYQPSTRKDKYRGRCNRYPSSLLLHSLPFVLRASSLSPFFSWLLFSIVGFFQIHFKMYIMFVRVRDFHLYVGGKDYCLIAAICSDLKSGIINSCWYFCKP